LYADNLGRRTLDIPVFNHWLGDTLNIPVFTAFSHWLLLFLSRFMLWEYW
jgi:hypothetical protein